MTWRKNFSYCSTIKGCFRPWVHAQLSGGQAFANHARPPERLKRALGKTLTDDASSRHSK